PAPAAHTSSPITGTRCTPTSATPLPARPGATTSTSTAGSGTKYLPPGKGTATEVTSPGTSRARPGPSEGEPPMASPHSEPSVHNWRASQLKRLGISGTLAEIYADCVDWHQIAWLVQHG